MNPMLAPGVQDLCIGRGSTPAPDVGGVPFTLAQSDTRKVSFAQHDVQLSVSRSSIDEPVVRVKGNVTSYPPPGTETALAVPDGCGPLLGSVPLYTIRASCNATR